MTTILELSVPASEFALNTTFERVPAVEFEFARAVAHDGTSPLPYLWAYNVDGGQLLDILSDDPTVADSDLLAGSDAHGFYYIQWATSTSTAIDDLLTENASIIDASGIEGQWTIELLFADEDDLSAFHAACSKLESSFEVTRVEPVDSTVWKTRHGLTDKQRIAILTAFDEGCYDIPRMTLLCDLAENLGITHQALSERLRRGMKQLIKESFRH